MDLDGDGTRDVISGSWPGELYLFPGEPNGGHGERRVLQSEFGVPIDVGRGSTVFATDWDRDGDIDLIVGTGSGKVFFVSNASGGKALMFEGAATEIVQVPSGNASPTVADWDGDGNPDLLVGAGNGNVYLYANKSATGKPVLSDAEILVRSSGRDHETRTKIHVVDWNADGRLDLLVGDASTEFGAAPRVTKKQKRERDRARLELTRYRRKADRIKNRVMRRLGALKARKDEQQELLGKVYKALADDAPYQALRAEISRREDVIAKYDRPFILHGNVWVYLRKARR